MSRTSSRSRRRPSRRALTPRAKAVLLGNPNNPTGAVHRARRAGEIAALAARHDLLVICDEVYSRLVYGGEHTCIAALPGMRERTILVDGFSKAYAMTGWRVGYVCAPRAHPGSDAEGPPVHHHVRADDEPGRRDGGAATASDDVMAMVAELRPTAPPDGGGLNASG